MKSQYIPSVGKKAFSGKREKALQMDENHRRYSRPAQHLNNLPDAWTDTKWIRRQKSWKVRRKNQWKDA